jgi:hypothetical protein
MKKPLSVAAGVSFLIVPSLVGQWLLDAELTDIA